MLNVTLVEGMTYCIGISNALDNLKKGNQMNKHHVKLVFALLSLLAIVATAAENLVINGDFAITEKSGEKSVPKNWRTPNNADYMIVPGPDGKNAVRIRPDKKERKHFVQNGLKLKPGKDYVFSLRYRGTPDTTFICGVERGGAKVLSQLNMNVKCTPEWQTIRLLIRMPDDKVPNIPYVVIAPVPGGEYFEVADVRLVQTDESNMIVNGDFAFTEKSGEKTVPTYWRTPNNADYMIVPGPDGKNAVRIRPDKASRKHFVQNGLKLQLGKDYLFTGLYRGTPDASFIYGIERGGASSFSQLKKDVKCKPEWQTMHLMVHMPDDSVPNIPYVVIAPLPGGEYFEIADLRLVQTEARLHDGDFENGGKEFWTLTNAVITEAPGHGKVVRLDGTKEKAEIRQGDLLLKRGRNYELSYDARGGSDTKFTDSQNATWYRLAILIDGQPFSNTAIWQDSFSSWQHKTITFTANRNVAVELVGELSDPGTVFFDNITLKELDFIGMPMEIVIDPPWNYLRGVRQGTKGEFTGTAFLAAKADKLRISFNGKTYELPAAKEVAFKLPIPAKKGSYTMTFEALGSDGKVVARFDDKFTVRGDKPKAVSHEVAFDSQNRMYLDGKPFFPIMTWRNRGPLSIEESYPRFVELGFNMIECPIVNIDAADAAGLYVLPEMPKRLFKIRTQDQAQEFMKDFKTIFGYLVSHPAVVGYFSVDEPTWGGIPLAPYAAGYRLLRDEFDPWRPVYINEAPRGTTDSLRPVMGACDIYGVDIYPIPSPNPHSGLEDKTATSVGKYTDICRDVTRGRKPIWMCLQGFAWGTLTGSKEIYPTYNESRFMAFDAIAHGATGLVYWGIWMGKNENKEFLAGLSRILHEVTANGAYLVGDTVPNETTCGNPAIRILQKRIADGGGLWIVLNESAKQETFTLEGRFPAKLVETGEEELPAPVDGKLTMTLPAYGVRVFRYGTRPAPAPLHVPRERRQQNTFKCKSDFKRASWIWYPNENRVNGSNAYFEQEFTLDKAPKTAELSIACNDMFRCWINGKPAMDQRGWQHSFTVDVAKMLKRGKNVIRIHAADGGTASCGLVYGLSLDNGMEILSGAEAKTSHNGKDDWKPVEVLGKANFKRASWVWYPNENHVGGSKAYFEQEFTLDKEPKTAELSIACDDKFRCWINGELAMEQGGWSNAFTVDVAKMLKRGKNVIRIHGADAGAAPCGLIYGLSLDNGMEILSGAETKTSHNGKDDWKPVEVLGKFGIAPWEKVSAVPYTPPMDKPKLKEQ